MRIELFGLPGCGKTTYVKMKQLQDKNLILPLEKLLYSDWRIIRNFKKIILATRFVFYKPTDFLKIIKFLSTLQFSNFKTKIKMFLYAISILEVIRVEKKIKNSPKMMMDEGLCQVIWGISYNVKKEDRNKVLILFKILEEYLADNIIVFNINLNIIKKRLLERKQKGGSELQHDLHNNPNALKNAQDIFNEIMTYIFINYEDRIQVWREEI